MLLGRFRQPYQEFQQKLQQLKEMAAQANPDQTALHSNFLAAQQLFQLQLMGLNIEELDPASRGQVQAYQTEINKQLRLLGTDVMFLQAARQSLTAQQRQAQLIDRLDTLLRYCATLLNDEKET